MRMKAEIIFENESQNYLSGTYFLLSSILAQIQIM